MLEFYAHDFIALVDTMEKVRGRLSSAGLLNQLSQEEVDTFTGSIKALRSHCGWLKLNNSRLHIDRILGGLGAGPVTYPVLANQVAELRQRIHDELQGRVFYSVEQENLVFYKENAQNPSRLEFMPLEQIVGHRVLLSFPSCHYDLSEAVRCKVAVRHTACVFHLMRALEVVLIALAKRFGVPSDRTNWHNIIEGIEKALRDLPTDPNRPVDWKEQVEFFSRATTHFMFVKDAWRNYTAHARGSYSPEDTESIFQNVKGFLIKLAPRLQEQP